MIVTLTDESIDFTQVGRDLRIQTIKLKNEFTANLNRPRLLSFLRRNSAGEEYGVLVFVHDLSGKPTLVEISLLLSAEGRLSVGKSIQREFKRNIVNISQSDWHAVQGVQGSEQFLIIQTNDSKVWEYYLNRGTEGTEASGLRFHRDLASLSVKLQALRRDGSFLIYL